MGVSRQAREYDRLRARGAELKAECAADDRRRYQMLVPRKGSAVAAVPGRLVKVTTHPAPRGVGRCRIEVVEGDPLPVLGACPSVADRE